MVKISKKKFLNYSLGYTLVELLVVLFILGTVGTIALSIFVTTLRGSNKSTSVNDIRQNGNYILSQMSKMIAYSQEFEGVSKDGSTYDKSCTISSSGNIYIKIKSFDGGETIFTYANNTIASNDASFIDTGKMTVTSFNMTCTGLSSSVNPTIDISFTLKSAGSLAENNSSILFETSITPRNSPPYSN
jgi:prepilin-type N-terminal cleavage/methylation domain-containing protein